MENGGVKVGLIYPHQLFENHPVMELADVVYFIDEPLIIGGDKEWPLKPHAKKLLLHLASSRAYTERYALKRLAQLEEIDELEHTTELIACRVVDDVLSRRIKQFCSERDIQLHVLETPGFLTPSEWGMNFFKGSKKPFMKTFYEAQRKRMNVLMDEEGNPHGGRWSFDDENRKKFPKKAEVPAEPFFQRSDEEQAILNDIQSTQSVYDVWGEMDDFRYPITHEGAEKWLDDFLLHRFQSFGTYEDALTHRSTFLYHSALTPMLNVGLLTPQQVLDRALEVAERNHVAINNVEGFVRQIIGWREFMALMYLKHGRYLRAQNFWGFKDEMPKAIYQWETGLAPVDDVLRKVEKEGYAHHIERLMVLGSFFMLMRIKPHAVYQWFSEMFIDAYDWVMVPNVYGMSQYSDGGLLVTKPYISGSNYIKKMSDYPAGEWCKVWDALFWSFVDDHCEFFSSQFRLKMLLRHLEKMDSETLAAHHQLASDFRNTMYQGNRWGDECSLV